MTDQRPPRRVLVISYYYPPYGSVGATRVSKMTKYLADHGWESTVLTVFDDDRPAEMEIEIPLSRIYRVPQSFDVLAGPRLLLGQKSVEGRRFTSKHGWKSRLMWHAGLAYRNLACFPDPQIGWLQPAVREGLRLAESIRPDAILSSSFPNTSHLIARRVAAATGVPWVAELRDLWTDNHNFRRIAPLRAIERRLEYSVLSQADALVTVSEVWARRLAQRFGKPVDVVPNGFDPADYPSPSTARHDRFTLVYTGMFYNGKQDPTPLLAAMSTLAKSGAITPETFRLELIGHYLSPVVGRATAMGLAPFLTSVPPVPYRQALARQVGASALLFLDWADGGESGWYSAKIYEYLGAGRPILGIGPANTVVAKLLAETGAGLVTNDAAAIARQLEIWMSELRTVGQPSSRANASVIAGYQRQSAARTMATVLDRVVSGRHSTGS